MSSKRESHSSLHSRLPVDPECIVMTDLVAENRRLSFADPNSPLENPVVDLDLPTGRVRYSLAFSACTNPFCKCRELKIWLRASGVRADAESVVSITFGTDSTEIKHSPGDRPLVDAFVQQCSSHDWQTFFQIFLGRKAECSEVPDGSTVQIQFPEDILANPSCLLAYKRVFAWSADVTFTFNGGAWMTLERYCTNPGCDCSEVLLDIIRRPGGGANLDSKGATLICLNTEDGTWRVNKEGAPNSPSPPELVDAFQRACPNWRDRFKRRQWVLVQLHQRAREATPQPSAPSGEPSPALKIGRNDRCLCGSGKKYKHCCGR